MADPIEASLKNLLFAIDMCIFALKNKEETRERCTNKVTAKKVKAKKGDLILMKTGRNQRVVALHRQGLTNKEIGDKFKISSTRVCQIVKKHS